jgi:hypothetical protein
MIFLTIRRGINMTKEEKRMLTHVGVQTVIDIAGGIAAVDIFKKAVSTLPTRYGFMHSLGKHALTFGAFQIGMDLAEKGTKPFVDALFKVKLDVPNDNSEDTEISKDVASEDDISDSEDASSED